MRLLLPSAVLFATIGCSSKWVIVTDTDVPTSLLMYYVDEDGDGWGVGEPVDVLEGGDASRRLTARNGRDCDDVSTEGSRITGRVGSVCPSQFGVGGAKIDYVGVVATNEFVATYGASELVYPGYAQGVCGLSGWGGGLATLDESQLGAVKSSVSAAAGTSSGNWAGWVGIVASADGNSWQWESHPGNPDAWDDDANLASINGIGFCSEDDGVIVGTTPTIPAESSWRYAPSPARLALVLKGSKWCLGSPTYIGNDRLRANFVCERGAPDKTTYDVYQVGADTDN